jgi:hypothetical protein
MDNISEGIIEGRLGILGRSDLSPLPFFGGGATRESESFGDLGGSMKLRHPASIFFMKPLLLIVLLLTTNIRAQDGSFSGTVFDLDSGRVQVINGSVDCPQPKDTLLQTMRRINAELAESNARLSAEIAASNQLYELRRQTRILQEIADK